jgi:putative ABC transport system ATP-binding protein
MVRLIDAEPVLKLEAVRLTLGSLAGPVNILNGIELVVRQGEAIGLVGPSGSGKSTMLMVMTGLERPTSGRVLVKSREISAMSEDESARFRRGNVGIVFQSFHLIPTMTALENVAVPLELALVPDAFEKARQELVNVGLGHRLEHYPSQLSGGEQQRVALARALAPRPSLVFADEPTGNLDGRTGAEIVEMMFRLQRERGSTLVLVTHDEALARRCDRIVRLRDGRIEAIEDAPGEASVEPAPAPAPVSISMSPEPPAPVAPAAIVAPAAVVAERPAPAADPAPAGQPHAVTPEPSTGEPPAPAPSAEPEPPPPEPPAEPFRLVEEDTVPTDALAAIDPATASEPSPTPEPPAPAAARVE